VALHESGAQLAVGDLDRVAGFWTEDVTVRRALGQPLAGREAARKALEPAAAPAVHLIYQRLTKEVEVSATWPLAFETGTWEGHQATLGGPVVMPLRISSSQRSASILSRSTRSS
jgi:ketosteroid isomerase-like protein